MAKAKTARQREASKRNLAKARAKRRRKGVMGAGRQTKSTKVVVKTPKRRVEVKKHKGTATRGTASL